MAKLRVRAALSALAAGILITIGGCSGQFVTASADSEIAQQYTRVENGLRPASGSFDLGNAPRVTRVIGPEGGTINIPGGHSLTFPAGALPRPVEISAKVDPVYLGVDLGPEGLNFPVGRGPLLTINYDGIDPSRFRSVSIAYVAPTGTVIEVLSTTIDKSRKTLTARLSHFSRYLVVST